MKRMSGLYNVITPEFCELQIENAARGKKKRKEVVDVLEHKKECAKELYDMLLFGDVKFNPHIEKDILDKQSCKIRHLSIPKFFPDHCIHWCYVRMMMPAFMRGMYRYTYGSIPGRGPISAKLKVRNWIDTDYRRTQYVAECDVHKCYQSINREYLIKQLYHVCKDKQALKLSEKIIYSTEEGLPIGDYPSPWLANFFLTPLDHIIKEKCRVPYYIRYMDNLEHFSDSKEQLHETLKIEEEWLAERGMYFNANKQVYPLEPRGTDFLGGIFHRDYTLVRSRNFLRFTRQARVLKNRVDKGEPVSLHEAMSINCRIANIRRSNHYNILQKYFPLEYELEMRKITSKMMRKNSLKKKEEERQNEVCTT